MSDTSGSSTTVTEPDAEFPDWLRTYSTKPYEGITHGVPFGQAQRFCRVQSWAHSVLLRAWKRRHCPGGRHALDEVWSGADHFLHCDACGLMVHIARVEVTYAALSAKGSSPLGADDV
jgi:hypothetical protein